MIVWLHRLASLPLARRVFSSLFANAVRVILQVGTGLILARSLGAADLGIYSWALAISALMVIPAQFGTSTLLMKEGARATSQSDPALLKSLWIWALKTTAVATFVSIALLLALVYFTQGTWSSLDWPVFLIAVALIPFAAIINLGESALLGTGHTSAGLFAGYYLRPLAFIAMVISIWAWTSGLDPFSAMLAQLLAHVLASLVVIAQILRIHAETVAADASVPEDTSDWRKTSRAFLLISGQWTILAQMDILILGAIAPPTQVGLYRVAFLVAGFIAIGALAMRGIFNERLAAAWVEQDMTAFRTRAALGCVVAAAVGLPLAAAYGLFGSQILDFVFGPEFAEAYWILAILSVGQVSLLMIGSATNALVMTGHEKVVSRLTTLSVLVNLALNLTLIPIFGGIGAAAATSSALAFQSAQIWFQAKRKLGIDMSFFASLIPVANMVEKRLRH